MNKDKYFHYMNLIKKFLIGFTASVGLLFLISISILIYFISNRDSVSNFDQNSYEDILLSIDLNKSFQETNYVQWKDSNVNLRETISAIYRAKEDKRVKAIIAKNNNQNMNLTQIKDLRDAIKSFKESGKPTFLYTDTFGEFSNSTSSYYLASIFDEIWIQPSGYVGLIGIMLTQPFIKDFFDKIGIEFEVLKRKEYKTAMEMFTNSSISKANEEAINELLKSIFIQIVEDISYSRKITKTELEKIINNGPYFADEARQLKLVDYLGYKNQFDISISKRFSNNDIVNITDYAFPNTKNKDKNKTIAIIYALGPIQSSKGSNLFPTENIISAADLSKTLIDTANNKNINSVILRIDSPGGSPIASDKIWYATKLVKDSGKKLIVSMGNTAASGGYYISMGADQIFAQPTTITGSIGVIASKPVLSELLEKLGINIYTKKYGDNSDLLDLTNKLSTKKKELINKYLDKVYTDFVTKASLDRNIPINEMSEIAKGRVWSGIDAKKNGLIDSFGGLHKAIEFAKKDLGVIKSEDINILIFPKPVDPIEKIIETFLSGEITSSLQKIDLLINKIIYIFNKSEILRSPEFDIQS